MNITMQFNGKIMKAESIVLVMFLLAFTTVAKADPFILSGSSNTVCSPQQITMSVVVDLNGSSDQFLQVRWFDDANYTTIAGTGANSGPPYQGSTLRIFQLDVYASVSKTYYLAIYNSGTGTYIYPPEPKTSVVTVNTNTIFVQGTNFCGPGQATLVASGAPAGSTYTWYAADQTTVVAQTATFVTPSISINTVYYVFAQGYSCQKQQVTVTVNTSYAGNVANLAIQGATPVCKGMPVEFNASGAPEGAMHFWYDETGSVIWTPSTDPRLYITIPSPKTISVAFMKNGCLSPRTSKSVTVYEPTPVPNQSLTRCAAEYVELAPELSSLAALSWYDANNVPLGISKTLKVKAPFQAGTLNYLGYPVDNDGCIGSQSTQISVTFNSECDDYLNWIESKSFRETAAITSHGRAYFDFSGRNLQNQTKAMESGQIFASQSIQDFMGREVLATLSAPTLKSGFQYDHFFVNAAAATRYTSQNFDGVRTTNPDPVEASVPGSLGWYFSENNTLCENCPTTLFPYTRTEICEEGTIDVVRSSSPGNTHFLGGGHEVIKGSFPIRTELDHYYSLRRFVFGAFEFENSNFQGGTILPWQNFNTGGGNVAPFQWTLNEVVQADGSQNSAAETSFIGQKLNDGRKWPAGSYIVRIKASNQSTGGSAPFQSAANIFASDSPANSVQQVTVQGDAAIPVGEARELELSFTLNQEYEYLLFKFQKVGVSSGYKVKITLGEIEIIKAGGDFQSTNARFDRGKGMQSVSRDENGRYVVALNDYSGKNVMTAMPGSDEDHVLEIDNQHEVTTENPIAYFYLVNPTEVQVTGTGFEVENIVSGEVKTDMTFADAGNKWPAGFYRLSNTGSAPISIAYTTYLKDVSYNFYDDVGRLRTTITPNGLNAWIAGESFSAIDKTTYEYNLRGWLLSQTEPDAGTSKFKYRKDGNIRFSQNELQRQNAAVSGKGKFSYTHYDYIGRAIESGEYIGSEFAFDDLSSQLEFTDQEVFGEADTKDWIRTHYDNPDPDFISKTDITDLVPEYLRGAVAWTENKNINTWYSYDEFGRVTWMAQMPIALGTVFVTRYEYDFLGNVLKVSNLRYDGGVLRSQFHHHYEYDKDQRLLRAYTSLDGENTKLRATYEYYLHGPLKRIELGDNLQGIDFVYNIHGWLTQINDPNNPVDAGGAADDVFGMVLNYYESDLSNLYQTSSTIPSFQDGFHLMSGNQQLIANHQPLIRFMSFDDAPESPFKRYGAQNRAYRTLMESSEASENN